jgi:hypothetical protein
LGEYALPVLAFIFGTYVQRLNVTMLMYQSIIKFHDYHNYFDEKQVVLRKLRANWMMKTGDPLGAWEVIKVGLTHNPNEFSMLYLAGVCMSLIGDVKMSEYYLALAEKNYPINQESQWSQHIQALRTKNNGMLGKKERVAIQPEDWKKRDKKTK